MYTAHIRQLMFSLMEDHEAMDQSCIDVGKSLVPVNQLLQPCSTPLLQQKPGALACRC